MRRYTAADDPGTYNQPVQLYDVPPTVDDLGAPSTTGTLVGTFMAAITNVSGRELIAAQQANILVTHRVVMPWLGSAIPPTSSNPNGLILPDMYLVHARTGRRYDIVFANNENEENYKWVLTCNEIVSRS